jgi:hypothetical protein
MHVKKLEKRSPIMWEQNIPGHPLLHPGAAPAAASLGLGPGDEAIVTDLSWVATAYAITYTGATCVFVDVDPDTWCIDRQPSKKRLPKDKSHHAGPHVRPASAHGRDHGYRPAL